MNRNIRALATLIFVVALTMAPTKASQAAILQKGITLQYNGKKAQRPIGDVYISVNEISGQNNSTVSDGTSGLFTLQFSRLQMGSRIAVKQITKKNMMVFNQDAVSELSVRKDPLRIILCDAKWFDKQKQNLINIGRRKAQERYDRQVKEIEEKYKNQLDEYYERLNEAEKEKNAYLDNVDEYADKFARIDESAVDTAAQRAIDLFKKGEWKDAVKIFERGNNFERLAVASRMNEVIETSLLPTCRTEVTGYMLAGDWESAKNGLKIIADARNNVEELFNYANFCARQNFDNEAAEYYNKALETLEKNADKNSQEYSHQRSAILNNMAIFCDKSGDTKKSEENYRHAIDFRRKLAVDNPQYYNPLVAQSLNNLGVLLYRNGRASECEKPYKEAFELIENNNQENLLPLKASICHNLANYNLGAGKASTCERMLLNSLNCYRQLTAKEKERYQPDLAAILSDINLFYYEAGDPLKGENYYKEALTIYRDLTADNRARFEPLLNGLVSNLKKMASVLNSSAHEAEETNRLEEATAGYNLALNIYSSLSEIKPDEYLPLKARVYGNLSYNSILLKRFGQAEEFARKGIEIDGKKEFIYANLAEALLLQGKTDEAKTIIERHREKIGKFLSVDFQQLDKLGVIPANVSNSIKQISQSLK